MDQQLDKFFTEYIENRKDDMIEDIKSLVSIRSVKEAPAEGMPFGEGIARTLHQMNAICEREGLRSRVLDNMVGEAVYGEGKESVGVLVHMDVVPEGDGWTTPPYEPVVRDGKIYGRGTNDDKGSAVAALYGLCALKASGKKLKREIKFIYGGDEESGCECVKRYLETEPAPDLAFSPDGPFPVVFAEKHIAYGTLKVNITAPTVLLSMHSGTASNVVPQEAEALMAGGQMVPDNGLPFSVTKEVQDSFTRIVTKGASAHASTPWMGRNAAVALLGALNEILDAGDGAKEAVNALYRLCAQWDGMGFGINCKDDVSGPLTMNLGILDYEKNCLTVTLDLRIPVTMDPKDVMERLKACAADEGISCTYGISQGLYVSREHELVRSLMGVYREVTGDMTPPVAMGGGTYARKMPCAVAFGPGFPDSDEACHLPDEFAYLDNLYKAARIYANALAELCCE